MSDKSFQYKPSPVPQSPAGLLDWLRREFIALSMWMQTIWDMPVLHAEPKRPRRGMVRYADGTDWDPGEGEGLYTFDGTDWVFSGGGTGTPGTTVHGDLTGRSADDQHPTSAITGLDTALGSKEPGLGAPAADGYVLQSTAAGVRSWLNPSGLGGGVTVHVDLTGRNDADQHGMGAITGLTAALGGKADSSHNHAWSDITSGLPSFVLVGDDAAILGSDSATNGWVLTADGAGGADWAALPAGSAHDAVTLAGSLDYLTIDGSQVITLGSIDLTTDVTGSLPAGSVSGLAPIATTGAYADLTGVPAFITASGVTYANLAATSSVGTGATQVAQGNHGHAISDVTSLQTALDAKVAGPTSAGNLRIAVFDGTGGKLIKDGGSTIADLSGGGSATPVTYLVNESEVLGSVSAQTNIPFDSATSIGSGSYTLSSPYFWTSFSGATLIEISGAAFVNIGTTDKEFLISIRDTDSDVQIVQRTVRVPALPSGSGNVYVPFAIKYLSSLTLGNYHGLFITPVTGTFTTCTVTTSATLTRFS
jgi:hypothetical protein